MRHAGAYSLRVEASKADAPGGGIGVAQDVALRPFRQYRARLWVKSEGLAPGCVVKVAFWTGNRHLHHGGIGVKQTQDWACHTAVFNTLDNAVVTVRIGIDYGAGGGRCWIDSLTIEEIGPLNILRRPGCPLVVRGENGAVYEEGRDFEPLSDPMLYALHPWGGWSLDHDPPALRLTVQSRIADGERLRVSYYHALPVYENQVAMCMSCDRPYELFEQGVRELQALLRPAGYHISIGEIRNANWDEDCRRRNLSPAQILADSVQRCIAIIRKIDPQARIYGWSDMLDPWHNATDNYYLANGSFEGTADLVPRDVIILNWNYSAHDGASPRFFAEKGFTQLLVGTTGEDVAAYLRSNPDLPNLIGVYALEPASPAAFAEAAWGDGGRRP